MISDSELVGRLREFLSTSDLNTTTTAIVRRQLEEDFGISLSDKKAFIREQVDLYLEGQFENDGEDYKDENGAAADVKLEESEGAISVREEEEEQEEEEEDEDEIEEETSNGKGSTKKGKSKEVKKKGSGFTKLCSLSPQLQKFTGVPELARTEVVKQLWSYIREHNLQDPTNKRNILCDEILRDLFIVDSIDMFQMNKALAKHIWPLHSDGAAPVNPKKEKERKKDIEEDPDESERKGKRQKGGFLAPLPLSDALVKFLGTGERALSRADVVKRIWDYIKQNNLQDPSYKRTIICDEKLKELFDVDSFNGFTVSKLLTTHFIKTEHQTEEKENGTVYLCICKR